MTEQMPRWEASLSQEKEQTQEEIRAILERAMAEGLSLDLVIVSLEGAPHISPDLLVEEIDGECAMMTYLAQDGGVGELIPLEMIRIKKAQFRQASK